MIRTYCHFSTATIPKHIKWQEPHRSIYSCKESRHPSRHLVFNQNSFHYAESCSATAYNHRLSHYVDLIKQAERSCVAVTLKKCTDDYDKKVRPDPKIVLIDDFYIQRPQHAGFSSDSTEEYAGKQYNHLMWRMQGPCKATEVQSHTVFIDEDGRQNNLANDRVTPVPKSPAYAEPATSTENGSIAPSTITPCYIT